MTEELQTVTKTAEVDIILPESVTKNKETETIPQTTSEDPPAKQKKRMTKSVVLTIEEFEHLEQIFEARQKAGRTNDWNHFIRQCINFTINHQKGWEFGVPANLKNKIQLA